MNKSKTALLSVLFFCAACGDADLFDTDKWSSQVDGWEPEVSLKVLHGNFNLWDLINQGTDSVIVKDGENLAIRYIKDDIYTLSVDEVFHMPDYGQAFEVALPDIMPNIGELQQDLETDAFPLTTELPNIPNDCELTCLVLSGQLNCEFPYAGFDYRVRVTFENIEAETGPLVIEKEVSLTEKTEVVPWNKVRIDLAGTSELQLTVKFFFSAGTRIPANHELDKLRFRLTGLTFEEAEGKILTAPISITPGTFDMDVDFLNEIGGNFRFTQPEVILMVQNDGIGVPMQLENVIFRNQGETLKLHDGEVLSFQGNPQKGHYMKEEQSLNKDNSNIVDFISMPPTGVISYEGQVVVNPQQVADNKVYKGGEVQIAACVRIPFSLSADRLTYQDTLTDLDIDEKIADKILEGEIALKASNQIPLALTIPSLVLMDERGIPLDTVFCIGEDQVIPAGTMAKAAEGSLHFSLKEKQARKLSLTKNILLQAVASTPTDQSVDVQAGAELNFELWMNVKAAIKDFDDF